MNTRRLTSSKCYPDRSLGFTTIELMIVIAILAIVAAVAAPSFRSMVATMNAKSAAFDLVSDLTMARSEAIKLNQNVSVTPNSGDWALGWLITDSANTTLFTRGAAGGSLSINAPAGGVVFGPNGRITDELPANKTWLVTSSISGVMPRCVIITPTGAARAKFGGCS